MRRNLYIAVFVAVLLVACVGGFVGGRILLQRLQGDFTPQNGPTAEPTRPATATGESVAEAPTEPAPATQAPAATERRPTSTVMVVPAPVTDQPRVLTPEPTWTAGVELPTSEPGFAGATPGGEDLTTPEPSATPISAYPYVLAHSVRYTSGDCPGTYALGTVTDSRGDPLAGVRLSLTDEYGNTATAVTKPGPGDAGHYDFPMGGPPRRFYLTVVDDTGRPQSQRVEILHDLPPYEGKGCRWVDWRKS